MAVKRSSPYVYVTWLTRLMAGEDQCLWKGWFKTHHSYDKLPSDFNLAAWTAEHTEMVRRRAGELEAEGYRVFLESQNSFKITGKTGITLSGKPDIVALRDDDALVVECKTGQDRLSDKIQVLVYMMMLPLSADRCRGKKIRGEVIYKTGSVETSEDALSEDFKKLLQTSIHRLGGEQPQARTPSPTECRYCDISKTDCPDRIEEEPEPVKSDLF